MIDARKLAKAKLKEADAAAEKESEEKKQKEAEAAKKKEDGAAAKKEEKRVAAAEKKKSKLQQQKKKKSKLQLGEIGFQQPDVDTFSQTYVSFSQTTLMLVTAGSGEVDDSDDSDFE